MKEINFHFKISHPNIVRLVGCYLGTEIPILVLKFIPRESLYDVLHGANCRTQVLLSFTEQLDIAISSVEAVSYMDSDAEQHVHGDISPPTSSSTRTSSPTAQGLRLWVIQAAGHGHVLQVHGGGYELRIPYVHQDG
jgi:serine/threonine protein kinase